MQCATVQRQTAVTAYLKSKQLLLFAFARRYDTSYCMAHASPLLSGGYDLLNFRGGDAMLLRYLGLLCCCCHEQETSDTSCSPVAIAAACHAQQRGSETVLCGSTLRSTRAAH